MNKKLSIILFAVMFIIPITTAIQNEDLPKLESFSEVCPADNYVYSVDFKKKDILCRVDQTGNGTGNATCCNPFDQVLNTTSNVTHNYFNATDIQSDNFRTADSWTGGSNNVYIGYKVADGTPTGSYNMFMGTYAGNKLTYGTQNYGLGYFSMYSCTSCTANTGIGSQTLTSITNGQYNVGIGNSALYYAKSGVGNIGIGAQSLYLAGQDLSDINNIGIGRGAGYYETGSNRLYIDVSDTTTPLIYGQFDNRLVRFGEDNTKVCTGTSSDVCRYFNGSDEFINAEVGSPTYYFTNFNDVCDDSGNCLSGIEADTNETTRFNNLVGNCSAGQQMYGVLNDGSKVCVTDATGWGADGNASSICDGNSTYLSGDGSCNNLTNIYEAKSTSGSTTMKFSGSKFMIKVT